MHYRLKSFITVLQSYTLKVFWLLGLNAIKIIYIIILVARLFVCVFVCLFVCSRTPPRSLGGLTSFFGENVQHMPGSNINYIS